MNWIFYSRLLIGGYLLFCCLSNVCQSNTVTNKKPKLTDGLITDTHESKRKFQHLFHKYKHICQGKKNFVASRHDSYMEENSDRYVPWTPLSGLLHYLLDIPYEPHSNPIYGHMGNGSQSSRFFEAYSTKSHSLQLPRCETVDEILDMVNNIDLHSRARCRLEWFQPEFICRLTSKYSGVLFIGDSLIRHLLQALFMILKEDWELGGFPRGPPNAFIEQNCTCDGQLSEYWDCRLLDRRPYYAINKFDQFGVCQNLTDLSPYSWVHFHSWDGGPFTPNINVLEKRWIVCEDALNLPIYIFLEAAVHFKVNSTAVIEYFVTPLIQQVKARYPTCLHRIHIVFMGATVSIPSLEEKYPFQRRNNTHLFNDEMRAWIGTQKDIDVRMLDIWNLTRFANDRSSDGFHFLSDHNMAMMIILLNILETHLREISM